MFPAAHHEPWLGRLRYRLRRVRRRVPWSSAAQATRAAAGTVSQSGCAASRLPAWWALILIEGEVEGTVVTQCPLESYAAASQVLAAEYWGCVDHVPDAGEMVEPSLFGGQP